MAKIDDFPWTIAHTRCANGAYDPFGNYMGEIKESNWIKVVQVEM